MGPIRLPSRPTFLISCLSSPIQNCHLSCKARTNCRVTSGGKKERKREKREERRKIWRKREDIFFLFVSFPRVVFTRYFSLSTNLAISDFSDENPSGQQDFSIFFRLLPRLFFVSFFFSFFFYFRREFFSLSSGKAVPSSHSQFRYR